MSATNYLNCAHFVFDATGHHAQPPCSVQTTVKLARLSHHHYNGRVGVWRSLVARVVRDDEAVSSSLTTPTTTLIRAA